MSDAKVDPAPRFTKLAMLWSYSGADYQGLQVQTQTTNTVEHHILQAILASGVARNRDRSLNDIEWSRSSRTDAGVSAARLITGANLLDVPDLVERVNAHLPPQIRLQGVVHATRKFNGRRQATNRCYEYLIPAEALRPAPAFQQHAEKFSQLCADQGWVAHADADPLFMIPKEGEWECTPECRDRFCGILRLFIGTHSFHNFCRPGMFTRSDPQLWRQVISWDVEGPHVINGVPLLVCRVVGTSFIHSQIRRMIGAAVLVARGIAPPLFIKAALDPSVRCTTPLAPGLGLLLDKVSFEAYERQYPDHDDLRFTACEESVEQFKRTVIYARVGEGEAEHSFMRWMRASVELVCMEDFWGVSLRYAKTLSDDEKSGRKPAGSARQPSVALCEEVTKCEKE